MSRELSQRLLAVLQLTRMALVFTAISNSLCTLLLVTRRLARPEQDMAEALDLRAVAAVAVISIGLYGLGMSLNDIIDRRRDRHIAAYRPLPSGRLGLLGAHVICIFMALLAVAATTYYSTLSTGGWRSLALLGCTIFLIAFYDGAGKYLVTSGLVTLGLIRFVQAAIPAQHLPVIWHPLLLFTHVTLLSMVAYQWEEKRPALTRRHRRAVWMMVVLINLSALGLAAWKSLYQHQGGVWALRPGLLAVVAAVGFFVLIAVRIRQTSPTLRQAGQTLMLVGLLWLIVYDAMFVGIYVDWRYGAGLLVLAPLSYFCVWLMRWWSRIVLISQTPDFKRVRNPQDIHK